MADPRGLRMHGFTGRGFVKPGHIHGKPKAFIRGLENLAGLHIQHPSFGGHGHMGGRRAAHMHAAGTKHAPLAHHVGSHRHAGHGGAVHGGKGAATHGGWGWQHGRSRHTGGRRRNA
jgi:hypothetical protein